MSVNDVGDNAHGAATLRAHGNINVKDSFERFAAATLSLGQWCDQFICRFGFYYQFAFILIEFWLGFFTFCGNDEFSHSCIWLKAAPS